MPIKNKNEKGNILVTTLLVMICMNLLAITLVQTSMREYKAADFKTIDSSTFYLAEACTKDTIEWFKSFSSAPTSLIPYTITKNNIQDLYNDTESQITQTKLASYSYDCTTTSLTIKSSPPDDPGVGENVSMDDTYGLSGDLTPTYYYQIVSNGNGPQNSTKTITNIISVEY